MRKCTLRICAMFVLCTLLLCGCTVTKEKTGLPDKLKEETGLPNKRQEEITQALIGRWEIIVKDWEKAYPLIIAKFNEDGTAHFNVSRNDFDGVYTVEKDAIHFTAYVSFYGAEPVKLTETFKYTYENGVLQLWSHGYELGKWNRNAVFESLIGECCK